MVTMQPGFLGSCWSKGHQIPPKGGYSHGKETSVRRPEMGSTDLSQFLEREAVLESGEV